MGELYKAYKTVKDEVKSLKYTTMAQIEHKGLKYRIIFTKKRANRHSVIHCMGNSVLWEQLPILPRLAGRTDGNKQVLTSFTEKREDITVFVIKGKPGIITGLDDGMFRSVHRFDESYINVMSEARFKELE